MMRAVILMMGPTGAGKTDTALALAERLPVEIVSVDSAMVYRGLDIGTAKPSAAVRARVLHHLIDIRDPAERYSAGEFMRDARLAITAIRARGRLPLLVGGTMLYFRALQSGLAELPGADVRVRAQLDARGAAEGWPALHAELATVDPEAARRIGPSDAQRIQRALEVHALTGQPLSTLQREDLRGGSGEEYLKLVIAPPARADLNAELERRFDAMLTAGLLDEVAALRARGDLTPGLPAIRAVGYRQLWAHLAGECDLATARLAAIRATRQLAKRQYTWLRAEPGAAWFRAGSGRLVDDLAARLEEWNLRHCKASDTVC
ncbi:MAG TPA: tRNA (adenosine(37)-N6)-dimethylallyltransferase MiaA [Steroidobacteraceae bacterium]|nr:tRNA (adenosine(37)-N6)-dimethylallyltransferase MiaA [Steroidobacteraceae bacterium]